MVRAQGDAMGAAIDVLLVSLGPTVGVLALFQSISGL